VSCSANSWGNSGTLKAGSTIYLTAIHHRSENPRNRCQARRESSTVAGAGGTSSRGPACGDATVQPTNSVSATGLTRVSAVRSPEGPLFRAPTRTARTRNTAWRRFSPGFQPRISGTGHSTLLLPAASAPPCRRS
jgi:hypothetical protein